ncbi:MAG: hypothetical protein PWP69_3 [Enterococcus sp.]|nr:hypothetical protein [Enterococcus sp.]
MSMRIAHGFTFVIMKVTFKIFPLKKLDSSIKTTYPKLQARHLLHWMDKQI